jgi:hypothetical protein
MSDVEQESEQKEEVSNVDRNPLLSAESRLDNLLLNSGEAKAGPERDEETQVAESKGRAEVGTDAGGCVVEERQYTKSYTLLALTRFEYHGQNA